LVRIGHQRAIVDRVRDSIAVAVGHGVASIANPVAIGVALIRIEDERAVVHGVQHPVIVVIRIAGISKAVQIVSV